MNKIIIINGPTGVGKTTIIKKLLTQMPSLKTGVTYMTRPKRDDKEDQLIHYISRKEFESKIRNDEFLEWAEYNNNYYGKAKDENLKILKEGPLLLNIESKGAMQIKKKFPNSLLIYVKPESLDQLQRRLRDRGLSENEYERRSKAMSWSMGFADKHDFQVINKEGTIDKTVKKIREIIEEECDLETSHNGAF